MLTIGPHPARPGVFQLRDEIWLPQSRAEVFDFFADAFHLQEMTPPWLHFQVLTPAPIAMSAGALIDYRLRLHGLPIRWRTRITVWEPPYQFVDTQLRGPYRLWEHRHTFEEYDGGTRVRDEVDYAVPGGWLVERGFVRRDLRRIFEFRRQTLPTLVAQFLATARPNGGSANAGSAPVNTAR